MDKTVTMTLLSDTIFGSGVSIPGAEDISVKLDREGKPYLSGSTFKGLLRESVENWLDWEDNPERKKTIRELFGSEKRSERKSEGDWNGAPSPRRVFVSPLTLAPGQNSLELLSRRTFTSIDEETGTVAEGTLRVASCIRKGTCFRGRISCAEEDEELVGNALRCIRYLGTSRTRGFGHVCFTWEEAENASPVPPAEGAGSCLRYRVELLENVRVTDLTQSHNTFLETLRWIPANAVRGVVLSRLARQDGNWFEENKATLLQEVHFTDLIPGNPGKKPALPTLMGFYEDKLGKNFYSLLTEGDVKPETKRAKLGTFCTLEEQMVQDKDGNLKPQQRIRSWSPRLGAETRINLDMQNQDRDKPGGLFQTGHLERGQRAEGMVLFSDACSEELRHRVAAALCDDRGELRLGANIHSGFGLCRLTERSWAQEAPESAAYGFREGESVGTKVYMLLLSPLMLMGENGEPRGLDEEWFSRLLQVPVKSLICSTSVSQRQGFNRTLGTRLSIRTFYQQGSMFCIDCEAAPAQERLRWAERNAFGACQEEGWGRILFLPDLERLEGRYEEPKVESAEKSVSRERAKRRARAHWLLEPGRAAQMRGKLSKSQMGNVQALILGAAARPEKAQALIDESFEHWMSDSKGAVNPAKRDRFEPVKNYITSVLEGNDLPAGDGSWTISERLELLVDLIKLGRKERM